jgi:phosphoesterase RecJ-like protein
MALKRVPLRLKRFIQEGSSFILLGHQDPDGDCVCSQLGLASFLRRLGKRARPVQAGPFRRKEILPFAGRFASTIRLERDARVIVLDCSSQDRLGEFGPAVQGCPMAVIDHHETSPSFGAVRFIDPAAPSVTFMVQKIIESFGQVPDDREAYLLFYGLCTDTGFFRHISRSAAEIMTAAGRLMREDVTPQRIHRELYSGRSLGSLTFTGGALHNTEPHFGGRLLLTRPAPGESYRDEDKETDSLYQMLLAVHGCQATAFIRLNDQGKTDVSLRSNGSCNVADIASRFGGGGHAQAAGFTIQADPQAIEKKLLRAFGRILM